MLQLLQRRKIPARSASHIAEFGWRRNTHVRYGYVIKDWRTFCKKKKTDPYDIDLNNSLGFLDYLTFDLKSNLHIVQKSASVLRVCRQMSGSPFSDPEKEILNKHVHALFNHTKTNPSQLERPFCWDVNIMLNFFKNWPENKELPLHKLASKMGALIMISTMCRGQELAMLRLSCMTRVSPHELVFSLPITTKTYNIRTIHNKDMQQLKIAAYPQVSKLCPMTAVLDYIH